ncbi:aminotransferase class V-fold PLP-dependent enzyme [Flavobacteriaceae bacterium AU392]|nr:aminotransferase class V-fold PLP-dependent enzyme [Flavobacteriaceae bacterium]RKM85784.1 aminotransferase class V-fold PLP-dependent enzyme [Flavobacteriaceae bacterium AU392]
MLKNQKHLFNLNDNIHYLNCAYKAPLLKASEAGVIKALQREHNPIDFSAEAFFDEVDEIKVLFGKLVNCVPEQVAMIPSTSYGFASVLNNIPYKQGQHVLTVENEFPSDYYSIQRWCNTHNAELRIIKPDTNSEQIGEHWNTKLIENINENTAIVNISSVHWMTGLQFDLEAIGQKCKTVGAKFIIDGTQSVGALPMDIQKYNIDALICASYKWLIGPYSMGLMYISPEFNDGVPLEESWMNRSNAKDFRSLTNYTNDYTSGAARYNVGETSNFISMPILKAGLQTILKWTPEGVQEYTKELIQPLRNYLENLGVIFEEDKYFSNHLIGVKLPENINIEALTENLVKQNIYLSVRGSSLRISVNVFNTSIDIERLINVIETTRTSS